MRCTVPGILRRLERFEFLRRRLEMAWRACYRIAKLARRILCLAGLVVYWRQRGQHLRLGAGTHRSYGSTAARS